MDLTTLSNVFWGIIGSLIGAVLVVLVQERISFLRARHGFLTGQWLQLIYDDQGKVIKRDRLDLRHEGNIIKGHYCRLEPSDQKFKEWQFSGRLEGHLLYGLYWSSDLKKNPGSYGTSQLHMINQAKFTGFYTRLIISNDADKYSESMALIKIEWTRQP